MRVSGVHADPSKPYRALGEPVMDSAELVVRALSIDYQVTKYVCHISSTSNSSFLFIIRNTIIAYNI
jgi:hypothetical protein